MYVIISKYQGLILTGTPGHSCHLPVFIYGSTFDLGYRWSATSHPCQREHAMDWLVFPYLLNATECPIFSLRFPHHNCWLWMCNFFRPNSRCTFRDFLSSPRLNQLFCKKSRFSSQDPSKERSQRVTPPKNEKLPVPSAAPRASTSITTPHSNRYRVTKAIPLLLVAARTFSPPHPSSRRSRSSIMSNRKI